MNGICTFYLFDVPNRPEVPATNYDGDISRKIVEFFINNYEAIWTPPESLRREVEDKVRVSNAFIYTQYGDSGTP